MDLFYREQEKGDSPKERLHLTINRSPTLQNSQVFHLKNLAFISFFN